MTTGSTRPSKEPCTSSHHKTDSCDCSSRASSSPSSSSCMTEPLAVDVSQESSCLGPESAPLLQWSHLHHKKQQIKTVVISWLYKTFFCNPQTHQLIKSTRSPHGPEDKSLCHVFAASPLALSLYVDPWKLALVHSAPPIWNKQSTASTCSNCIVISATDDHMSIPKKQACASDLTSPLTSSCSCSSSSPSSSNRWKVHCKMRNTVDSISSHCKDLQPCQAHLVILCLFNCFSAEHFFRYISLVQRFLQNMFWCITPGVLPFKVERTCSLLNLKIIITKNYKNVMHKSLQLSAGTCHLFVS